MTTDAMNDRPAANVEIQAVLKELTAIRAEMSSTTDESSEQPVEVHANYRHSARNLLHYLVLRRHDLRPLQLRLAALGLSSLGRAESHVLATIDAVLRILNRLVDCESTPAWGEVAGVDFAQGQRLLSEHTDSLLGSAPKGRQVRIMVTMPGEAADDYLLVHELLNQGMDCMRINCAHDDAPAWLRMIEHLKRAERSLGRTCRVVMDLAGPKLRTGPIEPGPAVLRIRPHRDVYGRVTAPARVWLTPQTSVHQPPSLADSCLPVPASWLETLRAGDLVQFTDARHARRKLKIVDVTAQGCWAELTKTAYVTTGTALHRQRHGKRADAVATMTDLPPSENVLLLKQEDLLTVTRDLKPGRPATYDSTGKILTPAMIGCTIPEVFDDVQTGESIWFDDGKIGGVVEQVEATCVHVKITHARLRGEKLAGGKGINLPDSSLHLPALTAEDIEDLAVVAQYADVVELSFANSAQDVESLQSHLSRLRNRPPAIVLKIETRRGFQNLPEMLLTAMRAPSCGVMIARGDLAVECGFERMAEVQEEILWICEAAHVPVIWATQVLETLAREGMPSRAEITDAAMGHRAECVMLNKGPHIVSAVKVLDDILRRMQPHQSKKQSMLRELHLAHGLSARTIAGTDEVATSAQPDT